MRPQSSLDGATSDNDEDQWTIVQSKKGRSRRRPTPDHQDFATPTNPAPQLDLQQITRDHDRISAAWREGASYGKLRDIISANLGSHVTLTNAVCLAVGSFDPVPERYTYKRTAHVQLEAFRAMVEILEAHSGSPTPCIIQEPGFSYTDKEFCESLGFRVVDTPEAFNMIDSHTLLYGIHLYMPTWAEALRAGLPGCYVGTPIELLERYNDTSGAAGLDIGQIQSMGASFDRIPFPRETPGDFVFSDTTIYWARAESVSNRIGSGARTHIEHSAVYDASCGLVESCPESPC